jgi:hypothetical protein
VLNFPRLFLIWYSARSEDPQLLYRSLVNLGKVQRFDMTLMFMTGTDKKGSFLLPALHKDRYAKAIAQITVTKNKRYAQNLATLFFCLFILASKTRLLDLISIFQHLASHVNDSATTYSQQDLAALASKFKTTNY